MSVVTYRPTRNEAVLATHWSCKKVFHSIDRPGMNPRKLAESLDDKIMGDLAAIVALNYLRSKGVKVVAYDEIRRDNFEEPDPWDLLLGVSYEGWIHNHYTLTDIEDTQFRTVSVKSSRIPQGKTLEQAYKLYDFKIFANPSREVSEMVDVDIESQVYYPFKDTQLGNLGMTARDVKHCIASEAACVTVLDLLKITQRYHTCYLTAWNTRRNIVNHAETLEKPFWFSFGKRMLKAPLKQGYSFVDLK